MNKSWIDLKRMKEFVFHFFKKTWMTFENIDVKRYVADSKILRPINYTHAISSIKRDDDFLPLLLKTIVKTKYHFISAFPYITLLIGLMRSVPAASHSEHSTKV